MQLVNGKMNISLVNGITGDPALYVFFSTNGEAALFDLGDVAKLSTRDLLKVRHVFVSHTHIDHFIGFDRLLRVNVPHFRTIEICGPSGIAENVQAKLKGFHWNLLEKGQVHFIVREISLEGNTQSFSISNDDNFSLNKIENPLPQTTATARPLPELPANFITNLGDGSRVEAVCLDHGTPSVAYLCQSPLRFQVDEAELKARGFKPGPWIRQLQTALANGESEASITVDGKEYVARDLGSQFLTSQAPRLMGYATDLMFSENNINRIQQLMKDVEVFICETSFHSEDIAKAKQKKHLTTRQAALIAATVKADKLVNFHISNVYSGKEDDICEEVQKLFNEFRHLDTEQLMARISQEFNALDSL